MTQHAKRGTVKGSLVVVLPVVLNSDVPKKATRLLLKELEEQFSRTFLSLPWGQVAKLNAERLASPKSYPAYALSKTRRELKAGRPHLLKVSVDVEAPNDANCVWGDDTFVVAEHPQSALCSATERLFERVALMAFASQLAAPGYAHFPKTAGFINDQPWGVASEISWVLHEAWFTATKYGWPSISRLPLQETDAWLCGIPGILDGMGRGRTGRAIAALSRIVCSDINDSSEMGIAWSLLGLEALYADGSQGSSQQILRKSEILLGPRNPKKPRLKGVYDYRSRFLHGSIDIPLAYTRDSFDPPDQGKFMNDTYEYWGIATCMLIATLQQMILRNLGELTFSLTLDVPLASTPESRNLKLLG
ncbi:MAG: hypothetical protein ACJ8AK_03600 [Gemmatimonadaceae bacterium]